MNLVPEGVLHLAGAGLGRLERGDLLLELLAEEGDLLHEQLDAVRDHGLLDELAHLGAAVADVQALVMEAGLGGAPDLPEPARIVHVGQGRGARLAFPAADVSS